MDKKNGLKNSNNRLTAAERHGITGSHK